MQTLGHPTRTNSKSSPLHPTCITTVRTFRQLGIRQEQEGREENFVFVGLNGKGYKILRGQTVQVPRPVYDVLTESERAEARQAGFMQQQLDLASRSAAAAGL